MIGPWRNGQGVLGGLSKQINHLRHWASLAWEIHPTSDTTLEDYDSEPNFLTYAAQHGLGLYIATKLGGKHCNPARKPLMIYALARCSPVECQLNPGLIELLLSRGEGPLHRYGSLTPWWELLRHPAASSDSHPKLKDWRAVATTFARHLNSFAQIWRVVSFLPPFPNIWRFDNIPVRKDPVSPSNVQFVKQQLRAKAETLNTNFPPNVSPKNSSLPISQNRMSQEHSSLHAHPLSFDFEYPAPLTNAVNESEPATMEDLPKAQSRPPTKHSIWRNIDFPANELSPPSHNEAEASSSVLAGHFDADPGYYRPKRRRQNIECIAPNTQPRSPFIREDKIDVYSPAVGFSGSGLPNVNAYLTGQTGTLSASSSAPPKYTGTIR